MNLLEAFQQATATKMENGRYTDQMAAVAKYFFELQFPQAATTRYEESSQATLKTFFIKLKPFAKNMLELEKIGVPIQQFQTPEIMFHGTLLHPTVVFVNGIQNDERKVSVETSTYLKDPVDKRHQYIIDAQLTYKRCSYIDPATGIHMLHAGENTGLISCSMVSREAGRHAVKQKVKHFYTTQRAPSTLKNFTAEGCPEYLNDGKKYHTIAWLYTIATPCAVNVSGDLQWQKDLPDGCNEFELALPSILPEQIVAAHPIVIDYDAKTHNTTEVQRDVKIGEPQLNPNNMLGIKTLEALNTATHDKALQPTSYPATLAHLEQEGKSATLCLAFHPEMLQFVAAYLGTPPQTAALKKPHLYAKKLCLNPRALDRVDFLQRTSNSLDIFYKQATEYEPASKLLLRELLSTYLTDGISMVCRMRASETAIDTHLIDAIINITMAINLAELSACCRKHGILYHINQERTGQKDLIIPAINQSNDDGGGERRGNGDNIWRAAQAK